ncbi:tetratricopeptide repeat protein [Dolichospermum circinale CS-547]|nr:tetratricopeptide repeat protein [Dolichospermum circinale]MDB9448919.1 tetratricopeptide repeat protein [Dolichospermum circinale CS-547]
MDWTTILKAQQTDFIQRLKSGDLLHCEKEGQHSELTVISGERLQQLRDFCWDMANKFKQQYDVKNIFFNNMKGKLGEEVVKIRLGDFVTEVDYKKRKGGDGKVDFTLTSDSSIGIQVKARYGNFDKVQWSISQEEIEKNAVLVCILIQEEVSEAQNEYHLILAGFFPTNMIKSADVKVLVGIHELLYPGSLRGYLDSLIGDEVEEYIKFADKCFYNGDYKGIIENFNQALQLNPNNANTYYWFGNTCVCIRNFALAIDNFTQAIKIDPYFCEAYYERGLVRNELEDIQGAIEDLNQAIKINPYFCEAYYERGLARDELEDIQGAIEDLNQAIKINPDYWYFKTTFYSLGSNRFDVGDMQNAIKYFSQAIKIDPYYCEAYYERGIVRDELGEKQGAIADFQAAADIYIKEGNETKYQNAMKKIKNIKSA